MIEIHRVFVGGIQIVHEQIHRHLQRSATVYPSAFDARNEAMHALVPHKDLHAFSLNIGIVHGVGLNGMQVFEFDSGFYEGREMSLQLIQHDFHDDTDQTIEERQSLNTRIKIGPLAALMVSIRQRMGGQREQFGWGGR